MGARACDGLNLRARLRWRTCAVARRREGRDADGTGQGPLPQTSTPLSQHQTFQLLSSSALHSLAQPLPLTLILRSSVHPLSPFQLLGRKINTRNKSPHLKTLNLPFGSRVSSAAMEPQSYQCALSLPAPLTTPPLSLLKAFAC